MISVKKRVVIVGGGFAGIGAARRLSSSPHFDITLLEASSRLGGRVCSIKTSDGRFAAELGATFLHGEEGNSLYEIARSKGLAIKENDPLKNIPRRELNLLSNGEEIPQHEFEHYRDVVTSVMEELVLCADNSDWSLVMNEDPTWAKSDGYSVPPLSLVDYVRRRFHEVTAKDVAVINQRYPGALWRPEHIMEHQMLIEGISNCTPLSRNVDVASYGEFSFPLGDLCIKVRGGYECLVDELAQEVLDKVQLNQKVTHIELLPETNKIDNSCTGPVIVTCSDGSQYHANHVIITVSLGLLKLLTGDQTCTTNGGLFSPPLPVHKLNAINKLGFGVVNKVAIEFTKPLVSSEYRAINLFWLKEDKAVLPPVRARHILDRVGTSNVWVDWFCGQDALDIADLTDDQLSEELALLLEQCLGQPVERPMVVGRTNWAVNPLCLGSYSYNTTGTNHRARVVLSEPVHGSTPLQLLFAGEATHPTLYSTTNGAYDTGVREAERLLKHYSLI